jgi:alkylation response protein AidB-like acyl-CoA dehydrogenase
VKVDPGHIIQHYLAFERPTTMGAIAQIIQAAVDVGIAKAAVRDTIAFVRGQTRPWVDSNVEHGYEDPLLLYNFGNVVIQVHAAEELLRRAGEYIDRAISNLNEINAAEAAIAVAEAKALATEVSLLAANKLFELAGITTIATGAMLALTHYMTRCAGNTTLLPTISSTKLFPHAIPGYR